MNIHRRKMRLKARRIDRCSIQTMSHERLAERARALGCPAFCNGWPTETLIRKIMEKENAR